MKKINQLFKALSEETRLRILALLLDGELCVCDLIAVLDLPQSTISRHLSHLLHAGWVEGDRRGVWMYYQLANHENTLQSDLLNVLTGHLAELPKIIADRRQALQTYLANKKHNSCA